MKKFIKEVGIFLTIILIAAIIINYRFGKSYYNHYELKYREVVEHKKKTDGIILGTSHGAHDIQPSVLDSMGIFFYNFSMNGGNPEFYWHWYKNIFITNYPKPKYCVWAVDWFLFDTVWVWRQYEQDSEYFPDSVFYANLRDAEYDTRSLISNRVPFTKYKSFKDIPNLFRPYDESMFIISKYKDGFLPYWPKKVAKFKNRYKNTLKDIYKISARQQYFFESLVLKMKNDGIQIILVNTPEYGSKKEDYEKIITFKYFDSFAQKNDMPFLNYNLGKRNPFNDDKELFTDWGHLNEKGSQLFSSILRKDLDSVINLRR